MTIRRISMKSPAGSIEVLSKLTHVRETADHWFQQSFWKHMDAHPTSRTRNFSNLFYAPSPETPVKQVERWAKRGCQREHTTRGGNRDESCHGGMEDCPTRRRLSWDDQSVLPITGYRRTASCRWGLELRASPVKRLPYLTSTTRWATGRGNSLETSSRTSRDTPTVSCLGRTSVSSAISSPDHS